MKKLILGLFLALVLVSPVGAQTDELEIMRSQLTEMLLKQVAILQEQLNELLERQAKTDQALAAIVDETEAPSVETWANEITVGTINCTDGSITLPFSANGRWVDGYAQTKNKDGRVVAGKYITAEDNALRSSTSRQPVSYLIKIFNAPGTPHSYGRSFSESNLLATAEGPIDCSDNY